jgi:hypothetical protein
METFEGFYERLRFTGHGKVFGKIVTDFAHHFRQILSAKTAEKAINTKDDKMGLAISECRYPI